MKNLAILFALVLSGCAWQVSNKGGYKTEAEVELRIIQMTKDEVLADLGPPKTRVKLSDGSESFRYESEVGGLTGGECTLSILFDGEKPKTVKLNARDISWISFPLGSCALILGTLRK